MTTPTLNYYYKYFRLKMLGKQMQDMWHEIWGDRAAYRAYINCSQKEFERRKETDEDQSYRAWRARQKKG